MNSFIESFERIMMPIAGKISSNKYLLAMRDAFSMLLPFIIVGSFFGIIEWVVIDPWGTIMGANGLNLGHAFTGLDTTSDAYKASSFVGTMQMYQGALQQRRHGRLRLLFLPARRGVFLSPRRHLGRR